MSNAARKLARATGRRPHGPPFVQIFHYIIDSPEFARLKGTALKMLIDLARQYNGSNNGDLSATTAKLKDRWKSNSKKTAALKVLLGGGWIVMTRQGGLGIGCSLYAVTWLPIDECNGKHTMAPTRAPLNLWRQKNATPESGTAPHLKQVRERAA
jgi:hypothetical protein